MYEFSKNKKTKSNKNTRKRENPMQCELMIRTKTHGTRMRNAQGAVMSTDLKRQTQGPAATRKSMLSIVYKRNISCSSFLRSNGSHLTGLWLCLVQYCFCFSVNVMCVPYERIHTCTDRCLCYSSKFHYNFCRLLIIFRLCYFYNCAFICVLQTYSVIFDDYKQRMHVMDV